MNWSFSPSLPTQPGLYVTTTFDTGSKPLLIRWHAKSDAWRLGARAERVDAFLGPIDLPTTNPEFADVEHLFDAPVSTRATTPPSSRARAFGQRSS